MHPPEIVPVQVEARLVVPMLTALDPFIPPPIQFNVVETLKVESPESAVLGFWTSVPVVELTLKETVPGPLRLVAPATLYDPLMLLVVPLVKRIVPEPETLPPAGRFSDE